MSWEFGSVNDREDLRTSTAGSLGTLWRYPGEVRTQGTIGQNVVYSKRFINSSPRRNVESGDQIGLYVQVFLVSHELFGPAAALVGVTVRFTAQCGSNDGRRAREMRLYRSCTAKQI